MATGAPDRESAGGHAIITGGSSGIGLALAKILAADGASISLLARDEARLVAAKHEIEAGNPGTSEIRIDAVDVCDAVACRHAVQRSVDQLGPPGWAIASAGIVEPGDLFSLSVEAYERQMQTNFFGSLYLSHAVAPIMKRSGGGRLVLIASGASLVGIFGYSAYASSKFAVRGLAEALRIELRPAGISVTVAYPPDTDTPQFADEAPKRSRATNRIVAGGKVWRPDDVAALVVRAARRGRFAVTPGRRLSLLNRWHSLLASPIRAYQDGVVSGLDRSDG